MYKHLSFERWPAEERDAFFRDNLYIPPRQLADGDWAGIVRLAFTWSVCMGITPSMPFTYRWCFEDKAEAEFFLATAQDVDEIPVRKTSLKGHRYTSREPLYREKDRLGFDKW